MNYEEMEPSRELDAFISREIFSQCPHPVEKEWSDWVCSECGKKIIWARSWYDPGCQGYACPYYSTNVQSAWLIVEYLGKEGCSIDIEWKGAGREFEFTAEVNIRKDSLTIGNAYGTMPEAVCKAALFAVGNLRKDK